MKVIEIFGFVLVNYIQGGVATHPSGNSSKWQLIEVATHRSGNSSKRQLIEVATHRSGKSSKRQLIEAATHRSGKSTNKHRDGKSTNMHRGFEFPLKNCILGHIFEHFR